jgi:hypothetical protein
MGFPAWLGSIWSGTAEQGEDFLARFNAVWSGRARLGRLRISRRRK